MQAAIRHDQLRDDAPPQQAGGASSHEVPVYAEPPPMQADGGPHLSRAVTGVSPTPRTRSRHMALTWTYALTLDQLDARGRVLRHVPGGTFTAQGGQTLPAQPSRFQWPDECLECPLSTRYSHSACLRQR